MTREAAHTEALRLELTGRVQGVGFRPFVYRTALRHGIRGTVQNRSGRVLIHAEGAGADLERFVTALVAEAPTPARPEISHREAVTPENHPDFRIIASTGGADGSTPVPPDLFACDECLAEMRDPADRRYGYPFINCTRCGPRYTVIERLPYDRANTAMAGFTLCASCRAEYDDPADRRYHAEPLACPECGPQLLFRALGREAVAGNGALEPALAVLRDGGTLAVRGVGGYHLLCDATSESAVRRLRTRKPRPDKPLAVMFPQRGSDGLAAVREHLALSESEAALLAGPERPIVLIPVVASSSLAPDIAPGLSEVGALLPYSPLHHLLLDRFGAPLVATSGNPSGEPVVTDIATAEARLAQVADAFLHHDRPILRPADDSVLRVIGDAPTPLRIGRGLAPLELELPVPAPEPMLALGGHTKNTLALAIGRRAILSPHVGDLDSPRALAVFDGVAADLQRFHGTAAERLVCDAHSGYGSSRRARDSALPVTRVWHHHAHASALYGEHGGSGDWLVLTWDGVGLGEDGSLWGGEALLGKPGCWRRVATLRPFRLPGGERAGREPWRSALGLCWAAGIESPTLAPDQALLYKAWQRGINAPLTSAIGRLFDGAAALLELTRTASFEGQGPMQLEAMADPDSAADALPITKTGDLLVIDWQPLLPMLLDKATPGPVRAGRFHNALAATGVELARAIGARQSFEALGMTGGVFQNRLLTETVQGRAAAAGIACRSARRVPCNDGGLAYGQLVEAIAQAGSGGWAR